MAFDQCHPGGGGRIREVPPISAPTKARPNGGYAVLQLTR
jgi:hypothetical protein